MDLLEQGIGLEEALEAFEFDGEIAGALRYGEGHINDTFTVYTQRRDGSEKRFLLQRINRHVFRDVARLMENIVGVTEYLGERILEAGGDPLRETLTVIRDREGHSYFTASDGGAWRCYLFIENTVCYQTPENPGVFKAAAEAFGRFTRRLEKYPVHSLYETIKDFHNTRIRLEAFKRALEEDRLGRAEGCRREIEEILRRENDCSVIVELQGRGELPLSVTHNDTKLNNILMDPAAGKGICVVDLDTVMPGLSVNDFGDAIRFGASTAAEDERDLSLVNFSLPMFEAYADGYLQAAGSGLTAKEKEMLPWGARLMTLECGIRFLTDHLEGDGYFKIHRPGHNLDRCRTQLKLVSDMEGAWDEMNRIIAGYS